MFSMCTNFLTEAQLAEIAARLEVTRPIHWRLVLPLLLEGRHWRSQQRQQHEEATVVRITAGQRR